MERVRIVTVGPGAGPDRDRRRRRLRRGAGRRHSSKDAGRTGPIVFELKSAARPPAATLMWPKGSRGSSAPARSKDDELAAMPQMLDVQFVRAAGRQLTGTLKPYRDPDCVCDVRTVFIGTIESETIHGTFTTARSDTAETLASGVWIRQRA